MHGYKYGSADLDFPDLLVKPSLPAANVEIVSVENHANTANAVIVNWRYLCESCVAGGNDRSATPAAIATQKRRAALRATVAMTF